MCEDSQVLAILWRKREEQSQTLEGLASAIGVSLRFSLPLRPPIFSLSPIPCSSVCVFWFRKEDAEPKKGDNL